MNDWRKFTLSSSLFHYWRACPWSSIVVTNRAPATMVTTFYANSQALSSIMTVHFGLQINATLDPFPTTILRWNSVTDSRLALFIRSSDSIVLAIISALTESRGVSSGFRLSFYCRETPLLLLFFARVLFSSSYASRQQTGADKRASLFTFMRPVISAYCNTQVKYLPVWTRYLVRLCSCCDSPITCTWTCDLPDYWRWNFVPVQSSVDKMRIYLIWRSISY